MYDANEQQLGAQPNLGWAAYLTVYSREQNVDSSGNPHLRQRLQHADPVHQPDQPRPDDGHGQLHHGLSPVRADGDARRQPLGRQQPFGRRQPGPCPHPGESPAKSPTPSPSPGGMTGSTVLPPPWRCRRHR